MYSSHKSFEGGDVLRSVYAQRPLNDSHSLQSPHTGEPEPTGVQVRLRPVRLLSGGQASNYASQIGSSIEGGEIGELDEEGGTHVQQIRVDVTGNVSSKTTLGQGQRASQGMLTSIQSDSLAAARRTLRTAGSTRYLAS